MESINFFIINNVGEIVSVLSTDTAGEHIPVLKAGVDSKLSSYDILEIVVPADSAGVELIKEDYTVVFKDITGWREYVITSYEDIDGDTVERTITAELSSIELLDEPMMADISTKSTDPEEVLAEVLSGTRWTVGQVDASLYNRRFSGSVQYKNILEVIDDLSSHYSAEITFTYEVSGNQVVARRVNMLKQVGNNNGKRFEIDKDVLEIKRTVDTSNIKTAIIPYGPEDEETGEGLDIAGVEWRTANGDPVNKPLGQLFLEDVSAKELWGRMGSDGKRRNRFITMEFQGEDAGSIASMAWVQLGRYSKPKITYEGKVVDLYALSGDEDLKHEQVALGDTAVLLDNYFAEPLAVSTRVVELYRDLLDPINNEVVLGESKQLFKAESGSGIIEDKVASLAGRVSAIVSDNKEVQSVINSKNSIYYGSDVPANPNVGDIWFKPHGTVAGETTLEIFNGTVWERELDTSRLNTVEEEVRKAEAETEALKQVANDAYKAGQDALTGVSTKVDVSVYENVVASLESEIATKLNTATHTADKKALETKIASKVGVSDYESEVASLESKIATKLNTATHTADKKALETEIASKVDVSDYESGVASLESKIATKLNTSTHTADKKALETKISSKVDATLYAQEKATLSADIAKKVATDTYNKKVAEIEGAVSGQETRLEEVEGGLALTAKATDVDALKSRVSTAETSLTATNKEIALKANKTDVDAVEGRLEEAESELTVQAGQIASKVSTTTFNALNKRVGTAETSLTQQANSIALKADKTVVDGLSGRVEEAESSLEVQAGEIASKVAKTDFDKVAGRVTTAETTIKQHTSGIALKADKTELDKVTGRLGTAESTLTIHAGEIAGKVSKTDFDKVAGRVTSAETSLTQQEKSIALKADKTALNTLTGRVSTAESSLTVQAEEIAGKVSKTEFDEVAGRVTSAETSLTQQAGSIALKADKTALNTLTGRVTSAETSLTQQASSIALKADKKALDTLTGRVSTAESSLTVQAKEIASKVSKTDFDEVEGRVTSAETSLTQQADSIALKADKTALDTLTGRVEDAESELTVQAGEIASKVATKTHNALATRVGTAESTIKQHATQIASKVATTEHNKVANRLATAETTIKQQAGSIALKAEKADLDKVTGRLSTAETSITQQADSIALKADKTALDKVSGRLSTAETTITQQADSIALKAEKADLDKVSGRVTSAETSITQQASSIALKADKTALDKVTGRLSTAETTITQQASSIALKANKSDLDKVSGRLSTAETTITQQASSIALKANKTELDKVSGRLSTAETSLTQQASSIALKADKTALDKVAGRLSTAESSLTLQAGQIASKVSQKEIVEAIKDAGRWTLVYRVNTETPLRITEVDGSALDDKYSYVVSGRINGTGTNTGAVAIFTSNVKGTAGAGWAIDVLAENGTNSNNIEFFIDSKGMPSVRLYGHSSFYNVTVTHEKVVGAVIPETVFSDRLKSAESSIVQQAGQIATKVAQTDFNAVTKRLSTAESNITQQAGVIASKVSQTDFNAVTKRLSTAESNITQQATNINLRVSKDDVINQINLSKEGILIDAKNIHLSGKSKIDNAVIKSAMIDSLSADKINVGTLNGNNVNIINLKANNITGGNLDVKNVKIMNGTTEVLSVNSSTGQITMNVNGLTINTKPVATNDYVASQASSAETRAKSHADTKASTAEANAKTYANTQASTAETRAKAHADSKASTAESNAKAHANTKASTAESNAKTYANTQATNAETRAKSHADTKASTAESNAKTYAKQQVDAVEIGGRNLFSVNQYVSLRNSEGTTNGNRYSAGGSGALVVDGVDGSGGYDTMKMVDLKANTEYIFTFNIPINDRFSIYDTDGVAVSVSKNWSSNNTQLTFRMGNVGGYIGGKFYPIEQSYPVEIYLMAEKGNKATDWTPAPEDIQEELNTKASSDVTDGLETALNDLNTIVADLGIGALEQQLSEYQEVLSNVQGDIESAEAQLATILSDDNGSLTKINTVLDGFNQRWQTLDGFIEFTGDGSSMTISKGNTSMVLNSDALTFFSGGSVVATITGQYMKIDRGIFVESMHIGRHEFAPYLGDRNHFLLQYVGEPSI